MIQARALRLHAKAATLAEIRLDLQEVTIPAAGPGEVVVAIHAAAVNPSDVKAALGLMPHAVFPRTPGRDFAGVVVDGPADRIGQAVFGSSGQLGISVDGSHASHLVLPADAAVPQPPGLDMVQAAGIGVPFVTAAEGLRRAALPQPGEFVVVMGANGKVGQAVIQIATAHGAHAIAVTRRAGPYTGHASLPVTAIDAAQFAAKPDDLAAAIRDATGGHGADLVFNTVGDPYFAAAHRAMAIGGRQVFIAAVDRIVQFNIFEFYRGQHSYFGIDTLALGSLASAERLRALLPLFADRSLRPFSTGDDSRYSLSHAHQAYTAALGAAGDRIVLLPGPA